MKANDIVKELQSDLSIEFDKLGDKITSEDRGLALDITIDLGTLFSKKALGENVDFELAQAQTARKLMTSGAAEALNKTVNAVLGRIAKTALEVAGTFTGAAINVVASGAGIKIPHL